MTSEADNLNQGGEAVSNRASLVKQLIVVALIMFGFGYALVPLYEVFCKVTGFGGKTDIIQEAAANKAKLVDREVEVSFTSHSHTSLPWEFKPITKSLNVKVGEIQDAVFYVKNYSDRAITGLATFNVSPPRAGFYFKKTECFCFSKQVLQPGDYTFFDNEKHAGK